MKTFFVTVLLATAAFAAPPPELALTPSERLEKLEEATGLSKETLELLGKEQPQLFGPIEKYLYHLKLFDLLTQGKDWEAAQQAITPAVESFIDTALKAVYPDNFLTFVKAVKVYHGILQYVRDSFFVPHIENAIYERYKASRDQGTDERMAFAQATVTEYFPAKPKMFDDYLKARGIQKEQLTQKTSNGYWYQIDDFWRIRLETHYQSERFKENESAIDLAVHKKFIPAINAIQKAAGTGLFHSGLFLSLPGDLPKGWWVVKGGLGKHDYPPTDDVPKKRGWGWSQSITVSNGVGWRLDERGWYASTTTKRYAGFPYGNIHLTIQPRFVETNGVVYDQGSEHLKAMIEQNNCAPLGSSGSACLRTDGINVTIFFVLGRYDVFLWTRDLQTKRGKQEFDPAYRTLILDLARKVAAKIPATVTE